MADSFHLLYAPDGRPIGEREWSELLRARLEDLSPDSWWRRQTDVDGLIVSTVWTGANTSLFGPPLFWETIIQGPEPFDGRSWRYPSRETALDDHEEIVRALRANKHEFAAALRGFQ